MLLYVTYPSFREAEKAALWLLRNRLVACVNVVPASSLYLWKGRVVKEKECVAFFKTTKRKVGRAKAEIAKKHPYEVPCVLELAGKGINKYEKWVRSEIK